MPRRSRFAHNLRREAPSAPPLGELLSEREAEGVCYEIQDTLQNTNDTLSVSPFGLPALPKGEPRALRAKVRTIQQSTTKNPGFRADAIRPCYEVTGVKW